MNQTFETLNLHQEMLSNIKSLGYTHMTPIQEQSLPLTLKGKDLIAQAKTGSGKTVAFCLAILHKLEVKRFRIQSLILAPTRELADQIAKEMKKLARTKHNIKITTLCGGVPYHPQVHSLSHQAHIIIGTPGRILKHLNEKSFSTKEINTLVLDEADRMLDMGFSEDINKIIDFLPKKRQTLLFSASYPQNIEDLSNKILINPTTIKIDTTHNKDKIKQHFYESNDENKTYNILKLLNQNNPESTIIFCNTKIACDNLADDLEDRGMDILVLHSDLDQKERSETLILFSNKSYPILIATDVAARGLDIDDIDLVINYDIPHEHAVYTHRIGRTARAGKDGKAISLINNKDKLDELNIENNTNYKLERLDDIKINTNFKLIPQWQSIYINAGKKKKVRAGDLLGALTAGIGLKKNEVGKIDILEFCSYVALKSSIVKKAHEKLQNTRIKGKYFKVYLK